MTEAEFMCEPDNCHAADSPIEWGAVEFQTRKNSIGSKIADVTSGYTVHDFGTRRGDVVACDAGVPVGIYLSHVLCVDPSHRRKGIATAMILAAVENRPKPTSRSVSEAGARALRKAWRTANP